MKKYLLMIGAIVVVGVVILMFGVLSRLNESVSKENRLPVLKAVVTLHATGQKMVPVISFKDGNGNQATAYVVRTNAGHDPVIAFMEERGWKFAEQVGSSISFEKEGQHATIGYRQILTRRYHIFEIPSLR